MVSRLRVAMYAPHFSEYSYRLAAALASNCDIRLVLNRKDANRQWSLASVPVSVPFETRIRDFSLRRTGIIGIPASFADVIGYRPDVIHCHETPDYYTAGLIELVRMSRIPLVLTIHDPAPHSAGGSGTNAMLERLRFRMRSAASLVTLHGGRCIAEFRRETPDFQGLVRSAMHGVLMVPSSEASEIPPIPGRILFFGRMMEYKGLDTFLDAVDILVKRGVKHEAVVAGRGPEMTRFGPRMASMPTLEPIDKFISPEQAATLFQSSQVVALPYKDATQSGVLASAFGNSRTVVASETGGIPDIIEHEVNGLLFPPGNAEALAADLQRVLSSAALATKLTVGVVRTSAELMNWDRIAADVYSGYRALLENEG
jgi:glycosyltransferase involved in cell wall biosynthesis